MTTTKSTMEMHLDASVYCSPSGASGPRRPLFDDNTFYRGYVPVKDSKGRVWWSDVGVRNPVSVISTADGETTVESANTFYRIVMCEKHTEEMKKGENLRYLPPLQDLKLDQDHEELIILGYDAGIKEKIIGRVISQTDDWYDVNVFVGRNGNVRYLL